MRASPIHRRLRAETAELHQALDGRLDLTAAGLRLDRYRAVLRMFYGFYAALEPALARLAAQGQLLAVTHSPQVAARARHHWLISKDQEDAVARTHVRELGPAERREEIARMLSGATITDEARAAAGRLLEGTG